MPHTDPETPRAPPLAAHPDPAAGEDKPFPGGLLGGLVGDFGARSSTGPRLSDADVVVWMGDFNYRCVWECGKAWKSVRFNDMAGQRRSDGVDGGLQLQVWGGGNVRRVWGENMCRGEGDVMTAVCTSLVKGVGVQ